MLFLWQQVQATKTLFPPISPLFQTEMVKYNLKTKVVLSELEAKFEQPPQMYNQTAQYLLQDTVKMVKDNTTMAINALETVVYLTRPSHSEMTLNSLLNVSTGIRWFTRNK